MNLYNAAIRLQGDTAHEVEKKGLTAAEIMVLRRIHGLDAVVRIVAVPPSLDAPGRSQREERDRLRKLYCDRDLTAGLVNELFGPDHIPLPATLDADEEVQADLATRERELKDTNKTTVTQEQLDALVASAMAGKLAVLAGDYNAKEQCEAQWPSHRPIIASDDALAKRIDGTVGGRELGSAFDPDAPDPETGRYPDHVIAQNQAKGVAAASAKAAERRAQSAEA